MLILLAGCRVGFSASQRIDRDAIRMLDTRWSQDARARDLDAVVSYYAPDAVLLPPDEPLAADPASIRKSWAGTLAALDAISWRVNTIDVAQAGDLAYLTGSWEATAKVAGGTPVPVTGKLLEVWKRNRAGEWKCVADTFNSDAAAAGIR